MARAATTLTKDKVGTRYVAVAIRTLVDPANPKDVEEVTDPGRNQDQPAGNGQFEARAGTR